MIKYISARVLKVGSISWRGVGDYSSEVGGKVSRDEAEVGI